MSTKIDIKFIPQGFAECLNQFAGECQKQAEVIASRASGYITGSGTGFHVEMFNEPRFKDSAYGVTRPVARVVANDDATSAEEAEHKILSKAVSG